MIWHRRGGGCHLQGVHTQCSLRWIPDAASVIWAKFPHGCLIIAVSKNHFFFFFFGKVLNKSMHKTLLGSSRKCVGVLLKGQAMVLAILTSWDSWWFRGQDMIIPRGQTKQNFRLTFKLSKRETWLERIMLVKVQPMSFWETSGKPKWGSFYQKINWPRLFKSQRRHREALRESPWYSLPPAVFTQLCVPIHLHGHLKPCPHPFPLLACWVDGDVYFLPPSASMLGSSSLSECQWGLCLFWLSPGVPLGDMLEHAWLRV